MKDPVVDDPFGFTKCDLNNRPFDVRQTEDWDAKEGALMSSTAYDRPDHVDETILGSLVLF